MVNHYKKIVLMFGLERISDYNFRTLKSLLIHDLKLTKKMQDDYDRIKIADLMEEKFPEDAGLSKLIEVWEDIPDLEDHVDMLRKEMERVRNETERNSESSTPPHASNMVELQEVEPARTTSSSEESKDVIPDIIKTQFWEEELNLPELSATNTSPAESEPLTLQEFPTTASSCLQTPLEPSEISSTTFATSQGSSAPCSTCVKVSQVSLITAARSTQTNQICQKTSTLSCNHQTTLKSPKTELSSVLAFQMTPATMTCGHNSPQILPATVSSSFNKPQMTPAAVPSSVEAPLMPQAKVLSTVQTSQRTPTMTCGHNSPQVTAATVHKCFNKPQLTPATVPRSVEVPWMPQATVTSSVQTLGMTTATMTSGHNSPRVPAATGPSSFNKPQVTPTTVPRSVQTSQRTPATMTSGHNSPRVTAATVHKCFNKPQLTPATVPSSVEAPWMPQTTVTSSVQTLGMTPATMTSGHNSPQVPAATGSNSYITPQITPATVPSSVQSHWVPEAALPSSAQTFQMTPAAMTSGCNSPQVTPATVPSSYNNTPQVSSATVHRRFPPTSVSPATPLKKPRLKNVPKQPSEEDGQQQGPKQVMVLKATEPFTYDMIKNRRMFHATVATETEFFRVKVFEITLKKMFMPNKVIAISDYFGCNGFLEIYSASCVSEVNSNSVMDIPSSLRQRANATPKIDTLFTQREGTFVNGIFTVYEKRVRNEFIYYGIEDRTGKMDVVVYGQFTNMYCEPGDKLKLFCFELSSCLDNWQLRSVRHSYMQVIQTRTRVSRPSNPYAIIEAAQSPHL